ncbi:hypothetical protein BH18ACT9_BH18ACT9_12780 [soil metagenome]
MTRLPASAGIPAAASTLLDRLMAETCRLREVVRTTYSVHYESGRVDVPVLCVALPGAVVLPNAVLTPSLPGGPLRVEAGALLADDASARAWRVHRWWRPPRPFGLVPPRPGRLQPLGAGGLDDLDPCGLIGAGEGLTPRGDDVLAAALVTAHATGDPRLEEWRKTTRDALQHRRTTAVSSALLWHALDGWCVPQLADLLTALCSGADAKVQASRLREVGHSSGQALLDGALHTLATRPVGYVREGAA